MNLIPDFLKIIQTTNNNYSNDKQIELITNAWFLRLIYFNCCCNKGGFAKAGEGVYSGRPIEHARPWLSRKGGKGKPDLDS